MENRLELVWRKVNEVIPDNAASGATLPHLDPQLLIERDQWLVRSSTPRAGNGRHVRGPRDGCVRPDSCAGSR